MRRSQSSDGVQLYYVGSNGVSVHTSLLSGAMAVWRQRVRYWKTIEDRFETALLYLGDDLKSIGQRRMCGV